MNLPKYKTHFGANKVQIECTFKLGYYSPNLKKLHYKKQLLCKMVYKRMKNILKLFQKLFAKDNPQNYK